MYTATSNYYIIRFLISNINQYTLETRAYYSIAKAVTL